MNVHNEEFCAGIRLGYDLGLRMAGSILQTDMGSHCVEISKYLEGVACGDITPLESGAEIRSEFPDQQDVEECRRRNQKALQFAAGVILDWYLKKDG